MTVTRVTRRGKPQEYLYLRPVTCPQKPPCQAISYQKILERTIEKICADLPSAVAQLDSPNLEGIKQALAAEINQKREILKQLPVLQEQGILDEETSDWRSYKIRTEIAQLEDKLAQLPPVNLQAIAQTVSLPQFWLDLSEAERRFYFREFIKTIEIIRFNTNQWDLHLIFIF
jgi:uncharacterized protein YfkK (UPF0435 family)